MAIYKNTTELSKVYKGATELSAVYFGVDLIFPIITDYLVNFLVVAGGGGAANGGGGAGGLRTSYGAVSPITLGGGSMETSLTLTVGISYTITVGGGGTAAGTGTNNGQTNGGNSIFSTITSTSGGANNSGNGLSIIDGGSGGGGLNGGGSVNGGSAVTSPVAQGFDGGDGCCAYPSDSYGGGGGASEVGTNGTGATTTGNGGDGLAVNILNATEAASIGVGEVSGSDVYYSGGGGAYGRSNPQGTAGIGGGGAGGTTGGGDGLPNTGGGAGSTEAGGSGVVILRILTSKYSGTTTGGPTVTTDGTDTILTYTGSGTYTA